MNPWFNFMSHHSGRVEFHCADVTTWSPLKNDTLISQLFETLFDSSTKWIFYTKILLEIKENKQNEIQMLIVKAFHNIQCWVGATCFSRYWSDFPSSENWSWISVSQERISSTHDNKHIEKGSMISLAVSVSKILSSVLFGQSDKTTGFVLFCSVLFCLRKDNSNFIGINIWFNMRFINRRNLAEQ